MPPADWAIGILARAIDRVERAPMPAAIVEPTRTMIGTLAPAMSWPMRLAASNLWLTQPLIIRAMSSSPETNATIRTTIAPTQLQGSPKPNVLAAVARAVLDIRLRPGDTIDAVLDHLRRTIKDDRVEITVVGPPHGASPVSSENGVGFLALARAIRAEYPNTLVTPFLTVASTNSGAFEAVAAATYRHVPVLLDGPLDEIHGVNEHIRVDTYAHAIRIYATLIHDLAGAGDVRTGSR
jgi:carboxypeptidase PM20D1